MEKIQVRQIWFHCPSNVTHSNTVATCTMISARQKKMSSEILHYQAWRITEEHISSFLCSQKQQVIKRMAGDGQIRRAQQRQSVMKTVQPYSILPCPTHPSYCLHPVFSLSHTASKPQFYSPWPFKLKCNLGTWYDVRFGF